MAFYLDPRLPSEHQAIPLRAAAPAGARAATWRVDGAEVATLGPPFSARWVPWPGDHRVSLDVDGRLAGSVRVWVGGGEASGEDRASDEPTPGAPTPGRRGQVEPSGRSR